MHEHRVVHGLDQPLKQLFAIEQPRAPLFQVLQQLVDGRAQLAQAAGLALEPDAPGCARFARELPHLLREFIDGALLPALPHKEHSHACHGNGKR